MAERLALVAAQQAAVGVHNAPPRDPTAPQRHHPPDLPRPALTHVLGDIAIRHHPAGRDRLGDVKYPAREVADLGSEPNAFTPGHRAYQVPAMRLLARRRLAGAENPRYSASV